VLWIVKDTDHIGRNKALGLDNEMWDRILAGLDIVVNDEGEVI
jgi:hypothetical protein